MAIDSDDKTVYRVYSSGNREENRVYHTSPDCPRLARATSAKEVPKSALWDDTEECSWCRKQREE